MKNRKLTLVFARAAVIAAMYVVLSFIAPSFGIVQFRLSEALTVLPLFIPEAIIGLTLGCFIANMIGSVWIDALLGSLVTLIAGVITMLIGKAIRNHALRLSLGVIPPILLNAIVVPFVLVLCEVAAMGAYWATFGSVALGQCVCIIGLGVPLYFAVGRALGYFKKKPPQEKYTIDKVNTKE